MFRLRLLGSQHLESEGGGALESVLRQPKRFAFFAYLAIATPAYVRRDTVLPVFWPELDQFAARRALRNALYQLRRAIGADVFRSRGDEEIGIDPEVVWCDAAAMMTAIEAGRLEEGVALYRGDLLKGFELPDAEEEFARWLTEERDRQRQLVLRALDTLTVRDAAAGHRDRAAHWALRAHEITPLDESWLQRAMTLLADAGDRGGAVRIYDAFARRLRDEKGQGPPVEAGRLAERIRASAPSPSVPPVATPSAPTEVPLRPAASRWLPIRSIGLVAASLFLIGALGTAAFVGIKGRGHDRPRADPHRLLVTVLQNRTGDPRLETLGDMAADWLSRGLFATGLGEVIDPSVIALRGRTSSGQPTDPMQLARLTGAGTIVEGYYYRSGDSLLFAVSVTDANSGRITGQVGPVGGPIARPAAALDEVRSRVMTALSIALDPRFREPAQRDVQPPPFPAYEAYIRGGQQFWLGDYTRAEASFRDALHQDTAFAQAAIALAGVYANSGQCALVDSLNRQWHPDGSRVTEADRLTLAIAVAHCNGQVDETLRLELARAHLLPRSSSALLMSANAALWADRPAETLAILRTVNPDIDLAWMPDSVHVAFFFPGGEADHLLGRYEDEVAVGKGLGNRALAGCLLRARGYVGLGRQRDALNAVDTMLTLGPDPASNWGMLPATEGRSEYAATSGWAAAWIAREFFAHGDTVSGRTVAARTLAWVSRQNREDRAAPELRFLEATLRDLSGDYAGARLVLTSLLATDSTNVDAHGLLAGAAAAQGDVTVASAGDAWLAQLPPERAGWAAPLYRARIAARQHRTADAIALLRTSREAGAWPMWVHSDPAVYSLRNVPEYRRLMAPVG